MLPGPALFTLSFLSLFVFNSSLFVNRHFGAGNHSLQTNASLVANSGIGLTHRSAQVPVTSATEACPAVPQLLSTNSDVLCKGVLADENISGFTAAKMTRNSK